MKNLFLTIVVSSVLLLIGCQENSIVEPIQDAGLQKDDNPLSQIGIFELEGNLEVPGSSQSYYVVEGQINYTHELVILDPQPPAPQYYVSLGLNVNAELRDPFSPEDPTWTITGNTEDMIYVSEEGMYVLEKSFPVQGREDGLILVCRFLVTTDGVGFSGMWLSVHSDIKLNKAHTQPDTVTYPPVRIDVWE